MSIKKQVAKGMMWNAIERLSTQGIQFVLTIVIARILSPDDYGLVAMLGIFMAVAQTFIDSGFGNALIQKKDRTEEDYSTMFYFNLAIAVALYLLFYVSAPWIARFYDQSALTAVTRVFGLYLITNSLGLIQLVRFTIALDFKKLAIASLVSVVLSGSLGVWMAYNGFGVWTLVFQSLLGNIFWAATLWILARWSPKIIFSWKSFQELFSFGYKLLFSSLLHTLYTNMYSLVIGKYFNASTLGYFNRSYTLGQFPAQNFGNIVQKVLYPIQCRYQDDDEKFNRIFIYYLRLSGFILFPVMIGFTVLATPVISLMLTDKWLPAVPLLRIICLSLMWLPMMQANVQVVDAKGHSDYHLHAEIIKKILAVLILFGSLPFGIRCVCWGLFAYSLIDLTVMIAYSRKVTSIGYVAQCRILLPSLSLALVMGGLVHTVTIFIHSSGYQILVGAGVGFVFYVTFAYLLKFSELKLLISFAKRKKNLI